jgi:hypothetical protein
MLGPDCHRERYGPLDSKSDYVTDLEPPAAPEDTGARAAVLDRIKQALVTSRLTLASQSTGANPYDRRVDRRRGTVWGKRSR